MPTLYQINITANQASHGRIAEEIGLLAMSKGWDSYIAYGRWANPSMSHLYHIGNMWDERWHGLQSRLFDNHGLSSKWATRKLIKNIEEVKPDVIHLHNIHGYYLNYPLLFDYLSITNIPVVWTLHDCWSFTGHCAFFTYCQCNKWRNNCDGCAFKSTYPKALLWSNSKRNFDLKNKYFNSIENLTIVPVSEWLSNLVAYSFLRDHHRKMIHNGIDLNVFQKKDSSIHFVPEEKKVVLGVSFDWDERKGLQDFVKLRDFLSDDYIVILIGLSKKQIKSLPKGIIGIERTQNINELVLYYSRADVFANPTYEDNFPTTNIEALACGTPVVTYNTGGSPEAIDENTGVVVPYGDIDAFYEAIIYVASNKIKMSDYCRKRAEFFFNKSDRYQDYIDLYYFLLSK